MDERPVCLECEVFKLRRADMSGWLALCTARSGRGRVIEWQYATDLKWAKKELKDKMHVRICPRWCPKRGGRNDGA